MSFLDKSYDEIAKEAMEQLRSDPLWLYYKFTDPHNPIWQEAWNKELRCWEFETEGGRYAKVTTRYREEDQGKDVVYALKGVVENEFGQLIDVQWQGSGEHNVLSRWHLRKAWKEKKTTTTKYINVLNYDNFTDQFVTSPRLFDTADQARAACPSTAICPAVAVTFEA